MSPWCTEMWQGLGGGSTAEVEQPAPDAIPPRESGVAYYVDVSCPNTAHPGAGAVSRAEVS